MQGTNETWGVFGWWANLGLSERSLNKLNFE